jgi:hypothetical protein
MVITGLISMGTFILRLRAAQKRIQRFEPYSFPYDMVVVARGQDTLSKAFFIGVLDESRAFWKFMDGQRVTDDNIGMMIPGYAGATLPKVSFIQSAPH